MGIRYKGCPCYIQDWLYVTVNDLSAVEVVESAEKIDGVLLKRVKRRGGWWRLA
ncbi:hypothetical protein CCACVL1_14699 [Corchorus capsularis]|uniref:Uncharacterized protein n=1 Tax=Corchorus capsularis TaxID=210143 RepID=A0A1R3I635_COCAP|nr:hypothetical protein CCACVL1_14699 [Corchorus capsularis]